MSPQQQDAAGGHDSEPVVPDNLNHWFAVRSTRDSQVAPSDASGPERTVPDTGDSSPGMPLHEAASLPARNVVVAFQTSGTGNLGFTLPPAATLLLTDSVTVTHLRGTLSDEHSVGVENSLFSAPVPG